MKHYSKDTTEIFSDKQLLINLDTRDITRSADNIKMYREVTKQKFIEISTIKELGTVDGYLYIGRETCEYCRSFIRYTAAVNDKISENIYYINSGLLDFEEKKLLFNQLGIRGIPAFFRVNKNSYRQFHGETLEDFKYFTSVGT